MPSLNDLTPSQQAAVEHHAGPLLVLAGPGSGKTRVITRRIARLVERGVDPRQILAITFTNKAANEMQTRLRGLLGGRPVWVSTFHRFCARLLRERAEAVGLQPNFTIFDARDQRQLIRRVLKDLNFDGVAYPPRRIASRISRAKNDLMGPEDFSHAYEERIGTHWEAVVAKVFPAYQKRLLESNGVDFDDLLLHVVTLLAENPELRRSLDERFRYVLVDEYQDTNLAQYRIVRGLSRDFPNVCVTGDPDQSIYGWRGARVDNILHFESDYPEATVVRLEQNFRSTKQILRAADALIVHNHLRKAKALETENSEGRPVELLRFADGRHEADTIAAEIGRQVESGERSWSDFALMYRVNALSRELEKALTRQRVPFQVAAGLAFYDRAEVKDVLSYLRLVYNPDDQMAFRRVVNTPRRGVGAKTLAKLEHWAVSRGSNLLEAAAEARSCPGLTAKPAKALQAFAQTIMELSTTSAGSVETLLRLLIEQTGYAEQWRGSRAEEDQQRLANVEELISAARQYDEALGEDATLEGFLETTSLVNDQDNLEDSAGAVTLMTLHAAKGLEFPVVYIVGVEHKLLPHERSLEMDELRDYEEERRLLFVGMTRAMDRLFLTETRERDFRGRRLPTIRSEFLREIDDLQVSDLAGDLVDPFSEPLAAPAYDIDRSSPGAGEQVRNEHTPPPHHSPLTNRSPLLTTGADLLDGTSTPAELPQGFAVGMTVRHPRYGLGTIVEVSGFGRRRSVTVEFDEEDRRQTFIAAHCPLQPVGVR